ncbi:MtrAB system histidine kinase MtrB [Boudabousia marimammalium]|uniref:Sensor histidine kinase MtrB n=1 Tax=Boudabousia marimammalium TaxID=156892 RepID=A0A1Q5PS11_9ACTO|nr:MtrAB system histidine kinase MtrB [Boudabousia marimammalium]OKL50200.1 hypothetical protein BM477_02060 [Boudabousia marimammalium]
MAEPPASTGALHVMQAFKKSGVIPADPPLNQSSQRKGRRRIRFFLRHNPIVNLFNRSLPVRTSILLTVLGALMVSGLSVFISSHIRADVFNERVSQVEADAAIRFAVADRSFSEATISTIDQAQQLAVSVVSSARNNALGARAIGVLLLRAPRTESISSINEVIDPDRSLVELVSTELRARVEKDTKNRQFWQSVEVTNPDGLKSPGIVIGQRITVPTAGDYEMYLVYSLQSEARTVDTMLRTVIGGSIVLLFVLALLVWLIIYRVLGPVRGTAEATRELASGDFQVRVEVKGEDELAVLGRSFNGMAESLETTIAEYDELAKLQQQFVSDVSHELRTPLTTIKMAGEVIYNQRDTLPAGAKRSAELLHEQIDRFDTMLADLLEISRYDAQATIPDFEYQDIIAVTERVIENADTLAQKLGVEVTLDAPQSPVRAEMDEIRIERVIRNLLVNAIEHADHSRVTITIAKQLDCVSVRVFDAGIGMSPEVVNRVFDRFYRADPARARTTGGTGLGLAIAKEDVNVHDGLLEAYGVVGVGSAFMMTIPVRHGAIVGMRALSIWPEDVPGGPTEEENPELTVQLPDYYLADYPLDDEEPEESE